MNYFIEVDILLIIMFDSLVLYFFNFISFLPLHSKLHLMLAMQKN